MPLLRLFATVMLCRVIRRTAVYTRGHGAPGDGSLLRGRHICSEAGNATAGGQPGRTSASLAVSSQFPRSRTYDRRRRYCTYRDVCRLPIGPVLSLSSRHSSDSAVGGCASSGTAQRMSVSTCPAVHLDVLACISHWVSPASTRAAARVFGTVRVFFICRSVGRSVGRSVVGSSCRHGPRHS
eukprot:COSAG05_NODE_300_length_11883_cov_12.913357_14_plen_182_part_00